MEIERKWLVEGWPQGLPLVEEFTMRQGYISVRPTVRIREEAKTGGPTAWVLCFKSAGGLAREEIERPIDQALFDGLAAKIIAKPLIERSAAPTCCPTAASWMSTMWTRASPARSGTPRSNTPPWRPPGPGPPPPPPWRATWPAR